MDDLISRQAVIEINRSYHGQMPNEVNHRIWKEINELPSAQPDSKELSGTHKALDTVSRQAVIEAINKIFPVDPMRNDYTQGITCGAALATEYIKQLPSAQPETHDKRTETHSCDLIDRQAAIEDIRTMIPKDAQLDIKWIEMWLRQLPSAQPDSKELSFTHKALDTISRQDAIRIVDGIDTWQAGWRGDAIESMKALPSAQPEIVRCKECKYASPNGKYGCKAYHFKLYETHEMNADDFCSRAERKGNG